MATSNYSADNITDLGDYGLLIMRTSMTLGKLEAENDKFSRQKTVAVRELIDNGTDEIRRSDTTGEYVGISFYQDGSFMVKDAGRGLPPDVAHDSEGKAMSGIYMCLGKMRSGGKYENDSDSFSSGLHGLGGAASIAMCRSVIVKVYRDNKEYSLHFKDWKPGFFEDENNPDSSFESISDLTYVKELDDNRPLEEKEKYPTGTYIHGWFNDAVFSSKKPYNSRELIERLRDVAYLTPNLKVEVYDEQQPITDENTGNTEPYQDFFYFGDKGLEEMLLAHMPDEPITEPIILRGEGSYIQENVPILQSDGKTFTYESVKRRLPISIAFAWGSKYDYTLSSYVNTINTRDGGVHVSGFESALSQAFNDKVSTMRGFLKKDEKNPLFTDYEKGLTAIVSVSIAEPSFDGQAKDSVSGGEVEKAMRAESKRIIAEWVASNTETVKVIAQKVITEARARVRNEKNRSAKRLEQEINRTVAMPSKLSDCRQAGKGGAELYIAEGESAGTPLRNARDSNIHAILPLRGVPINPLTNSRKDVLNNAEINAMIVALGAGIGADFDPDKARYDAIYLASDADVDGSHISLIMLYIIWSLFPGMIEQNRVYAINTPLYEIRLKGGKRNGEKVYALNDDEQITITNALRAEGQKYKQSRLKGLGEVPADVLYESAFNPDTRILTQITFSEKDAQEVEERFDFFNNANRVEERRNWIMTFRTVPGEEE